MRFPLYRQQVAVDHDLIDLFVPDADAVKQAWQSGTIPFPYWSQVWPSAKALARFLVQQPSFIQNKTVLELGAGLGLPSLVAARYATQVHCTDYAAEAMELAAKSAAHAGLKNITASVLDWQHLPPGMNADVLLLSDINYQPSAFRSLQEVITFFLRKQTTIILSTPHRLMAREFVAPLLVNSTQQQQMNVTHEGKPVAITVMVLQKNQLPTDGC